MNAFSDFIQWRRRSKYLDSVDKKVKIFFGDRGIRNLTLIGVKQGKPAQNFDGEYIPKKRKIVINSELLDRAMDHDRGKELIVEVLVHEYMHAIKDINSPFLTDKIIWGNGLVQVDEILASLGAAILLEKSKEELIEEIRAGVKIRFPDYQRYDPSKPDEYWKSITDSFSYKGEYILGRITALCMSDKSKEEKIGAVNYLMGERNNYAAYQRILEIGKDHMSFLPEDVKVRLLHYGP
jgi:hypothetical protein